MNKVLFVKILEVNSEEEIRGAIQLVDKRFLPFNNGRWRFNWNELNKVEGSQLFGFVCLNSPDHIEGLIMLTLFNGEMLFMNNIELAPHNVGMDKKFENIAGCLLAYACRNSFEIGKGNYNGYLSFDSKTALISLYIKKYGATLASGNKMYFSPEAGKRLMKKYLGIRK